MDSTELYVLTKIRQGNSRGCYKFYLKDLYWGKTKKKIGSYPGNAVREALTSLSNKRKIDVIVSQKAGKGGYFQIVCL